MAVIPIGEPGRKLRKRIAANRAHLFVFITNRDVPYTNNVSERNLRPSVIFRKVTNGFRCEWGAETYAAFRSVVSTAKVNRRSSSTTYARCWAARHTAGPSPSRGEQLPVGSTQVVGLCTYIIYFGQPSRAECPDPIQIPWLTARVGE